MAVNRDIFKSAKQKETGGIISVWDKLQAHDSNLYEQEQEVRRFKKRQGQMVMRAKMKNQKPSLVPKKKKTR